MLQRLLFETQYLHDVRLMCAPSNECPKRGKPSLHPNHVCLKPGPGRTVCDTHLHKCLNTIHMLKLYFGIFNYTQKQREECDKAHVATSRPQELSMCHVFIHPSHRLLSSLLCSHIHLSLYAATLSHTLVRGQERVASRKLPVPGRLLASQQPNSFST